MDGFVWLLLLCAAMFCGAYVAGMLPLTCALNASRLRSITIFGAGLLVGTALIVIIPEGVAMHYQSQLEVSAAHVHVDAVPQRVADTHAGDEHSHGSHRHLFAAAALRSSTLGDAQSATAAPQRVRAASIRSGFVPRGVAATPGFVDRGSRGWVANSVAGEKKFKPAPLQSRVTEVVSRVRSLAMSTASAFVQAFVGGTAAAAEPSPSVDAVVKVAVSVPVADSAARAASAVTSAGPRSLKGRRAHSHPAVSEVSETSSGEEVAEDGDGDTAVDVQDAAVDGTAGVAPVSLMDGGSGEESQQNAESTPHAHHTHGDSWHIGAALALGFAFQLIVDRLSGGLHSHGGPAVGMGGTTSTDGAAAPSASGDAPVPVRSPPPGGDDSSKSKSAMAGLVVHAMVDGVALGAAVREGDGALGMLVFIAIMLHKAPSSFGLASYLLHHGISRVGVQRRLLLFSSAAPTGAIVTYLLLSANLFSYKQESVALCLLFSGGTFLYVATAHILPEIQAGEYGLIPDEDDVGHGHSHGGHPKPHPKMRWRDVWTLVFGVLLPLALNLPHGH